MPATALSNPDMFTNMATSILDTVKDTLECNNLEVPARMYIGFDRPPQDCCPELTAWIGNVRVWDADTMDGRLAGELRCINGYAFDITIRIGRCYVDVQENGNPMDTQTIADWTAILNRDAAAIYFGFISEWRAGNVTELTTCDAVNVSTMTAYHEGGCGGWEFTVSVGVL